MIKIGLTGSIGMGKSTTAQLFSDEGVPVYDADLAVHQLYHGRAVPLIAAAFPDAITDDYVDRQKLGQLVLNKPEQLKLLETIIHPLVHQEEQKFLEQAEKSGAKFVVLDIPLLFETGGEARVDKIVVVSAPSEIQKQRVLARNSMTEEKFQAILQRQLPDADKRKRADFIIETGQGIEHARSQVKQILQKLRLCKNNSGKNNPEDGRI